MDAPSEKDGGVQPVPMMTQSPMRTNPMDLTGRKVLVTGASSGIGRQTAALISELGGSVALVARRADQLAGSESLLHGSAHHTEAFDLNSVVEIPGWLEGVSERVGPFGGLVHRAGIHWDYSAWVERTPHFPEGEVAYVGSDRGN